MTLKFTPVSKSNEHCIITNYQPLPENGPHFCLIANCLQLGIHQLIIIFKSHVYLAYTGNYY